MSSYEQLPSIAQDVDDLFRRIDLSEFLWPEDDDDGELELAPECDDDEYRRRFPRLPPDEDDDVGLRIEYDDGEHLQEPKLAW